jgi:hypothetical protein
MHHIGSTPFKMVSVFGYRLFHHFRTIASRETQEIDIEPRARAWILATY